MAERGNIVEGDVDRAFGLPIDPAIRAVILIEERLKSMEEHSRERSDAINRVEAKVDGQQVQISTIVTDIAVLKAQHASFWKGATVLMTTISLIAGAIGWIVSQMMAFFGAHGGH